MSIIKKEILLNIIDVVIQLTRDPDSLKVNKKISCADCFAAALANLNKGEIITGDQRFKALVSEEKIS